MAQDNPVPTSGGQTAAQGAVNAPAQPATALGEVVVTARGRAEKLIDVPISVQNFSQAQLQADNINDLSTLQYSAGFTFNSQGVTYTGGGRQYPSLIFRGLSSNFGGAFGGSSGALFVDGIFISGGLASVTLADASQVEVLKGPQNVYFGKNTFGGAVNLITANPSESYHASATAGYSDKGSYDDVFSAEGAIVPGLLTGRVTGELFHQGTQYRAADGGSLGEEDTKGVTVDLYATPAPGLWLKSRFHYSHDDDSTAQDGLLDGTAYGTACPGLINPYFCNGVPTLNRVNPGAVLSGTAIPQALVAAVQSDNFGGGAQQPYLNSVPRPDGAGLDRDNIQASILGGAKLPYDANFQFSAGYNSANSDDLTAADHTPTPFFITNTATIYHDFEADARIATNPNYPLRAVIGGNYFESTEQVGQGGSYYGFLVSQFAPPVNEDDKTDAIYGSLDYDILPYLTATAEVRYQKDTVSDTVTGTSVSKSFYHALPRFILKYHPTHATDVYVSYSEGIQPPQLQNAYINAEAAASPAHPNYAEAALAQYGVTSPYTSDPKVRVWEVGLKQSLFNDRAFFSIDYYHEYWDNSLVNTYIFDPVSCGQVPYPENTSAQCALGSSGAAIYGLSNDHIQGIEFDGTARVTEKLTVHGAFNWTDAFRTSYNDQSYAGAFVSGVEPSQNGNRVSFVPQYQASLDATYKDHLIGPYNWYVHGLLTYTGPEYVDPTDIAEINGYARVNLSAGVTRGDLTFEAFVTNLFDNKDWDLGVNFDSSDHGFSEAYQSLIVTAPNPRDFGFKVSAKF